MCFISRTSRSGNETMPYLYAVCLRQAFQPPHRRVIHFAGELQYYPRLQHRRLICLRSPRHRSYFRHFLRAQNQLFLICHPILLSKQSEIPAYCTLESHQYTGAYLRASWNSEPFGLLGYASSFFRISSSVRFTGLRATCRRE